MWKGLFFIFIFLGSANTYSENASKEFVMLYQFTGMKKEQQKVEQVMLPILPVKLRYEASFGLKHHDTSQPVPSKRILDKSAQKTKKEIYGQMKRYTIFDIETWKTNIHTDEQTARQSMSKYIRTINEMKKRLPGYRIGNYGKPVHRNYRATRDEIKDERYYQWKRRNDMLKPLADSLDVFYPSLYTFELNKIDKWIRFAKEHIKESRRLATKGQPVIAFIWPQYHGGSKYKGQFIGYDFWKVQLETLFEIADGIVIWSNHKGPLDTKSGWFRATHDFIESLDRQGIRINNFSNP